ncbi:MAG TPA: dihydrofolate reductase family protein [Cyclobacteriaceae bacterium]|nr:dihydrofolate reductase family protein [Cyclobacteriaceae bacterium]
MRKILLNVAVTLDGFIAGPKGEYDWCFTDDDYGMTEFMASVDTILMGRKSFDLVQQYGPPYPDKEIIVVSSTLKETPFENVVIVNDDLPRYVSNLVKSKGKNIWLFGGATVAGVLFERNLIDEMHLAIHPIVLGNGISLFKKGVRRSLRLSRSITYPSGLVQLIYNKI